MVKRNVVLVSYVKIGTGLTTALVRGDVAAVKLLLMLKCCS